MQGSLEARQPCARQHRTSVTFRAQWHETGHPVSHSLAWNGVLRPPSAPPILAERRSCQGHGATSLRGATCRREALTAPSTATQSVSCAIRDETERAIGTETQQHLAESARWPAAERCRRVEAIHLPGRPGRSRDRQRSPRRRDYASYGADLQTSVSRQRRRSTSGARAAKLISDHLSV